MKSTNQNQSAQTNRTFLPTERKILKLLYSHTIDLSAKYIINNLGLPRRTIYDNLKSLLKKKVIDHIRPLYQLCDRSGKSVKSALSEVNLHDFSFVIRLIKSPDWWSKRNNKLMKLKEYHVRPLSLRNNPYHQLMDDTYFIQIFTNSIIFIDKNKYYGNSGWDCYLQAFETFITQLKLLEERLNFKFFRDNIPQVQVRSSHYVNLTDDLSKFCKRTGNKFELIINGKRRAWIDLSEPYGTEFGHKNYANGDIGKYRENIKDIVSKESYLPSDVKGIIDKQIHFNQQIQENQGVFDKNMSTHLNVLDKIGNGIIENTNVINKLVGLMSMISSKQQVIKSINTPLDVLKHKNEIQQLSQQEKDKITKRLWDNADR